MQIIKRIVRWKKNVDQHADRHCDPMAWKKQIMENEVLTEGWRDDIHYYTSCRLCQR